MTYAEPRIDFSHALERPTILVVENDPVLGDLWKTILETAGYTCVEARDGLEALSIIDRHSTIDIILSDFQMPKLNGLQLLQGLKHTQKTKCIPFILITGNLSFLLRKQALRNGAHAILHKPFTQYEILHILNRALSLKPKISSLLGHPVLEEVRR